MGEAKAEGHQGKLFFGLLAHSVDLIEEVCRRVQLDFSPITLRSEAIPFTHTGYYAHEMGSDLLRQWVATDDQIYVDELPAVKLLTNRLERVYASARGRRVNIDPGYLTLSKVVLATTKDYDHRVYVRDGIFEEVTLHYRRQSGYEPWPWTYPDYRSDTALAFFARLREQLASESRI